MSNDLQSLCQLAADRQGVCTTLGLLEHDHTTPKGKRDALYRELVRLDTAINHGFQEIGRPNDDEIKAAWEEFKEKETTDVD